MTALSVLIFCEISAQAPGLINYQAVARNAQTGAELANQEVFLQAIVRAGGPSGTLVYQETHDDVATNAYGLFSIQIGGGEPLSGSLLNIDWSSDAYWLEIELDAGEGLETMGAMQLVSVPYALHAHTVDNADDDDPDPTNELVLDFAFDPVTSILTLEDAGNNFNLDLSPLIPDADADPTNELVFEFSFDPATSILTLEDAGNNYNLDLSSLIPDADSDPNNERIEGVFYNAGSNTLTITEGGQNYSTGLGPIDEDIDPTNELIDEDGLNLTDGLVLEISEAGILHTVDLSPIAQSTAWQHLTEDEIVFNENDDVGIGTEAPAARLDVRGLGDADKPLLAVSPEGEGPSFSVTANTVQIPETSVLRIEGEARYNTTVITNSGGLSQINYTVAGADSYILLYFSNSSFTSHTVSLPPATSCPGRVISVSREISASSSLQIVGSLLIDTGTDAVNFDTPNYSVPGSSPDRTQLISLGDDGWLLLR